jgi:Na+/H+ antiporter NhaB
MESCNFSTFSQAVLQSLHTSQLDLNDILAVVTDNASYCLKAYREVLKGVMPHSVHTTCLCHVINLVGETWQHYKYFSEVTALVMWVKSAFFKKPARKRRWLYFLTMKEAEKPKVE